MNAQDFKAGLEKLRREYNDEEKLQDITLRRSETTLELIFKAIQEAAGRGQKYIALGKHFGDLDWYVVQTLHASGCRSVPVYDEQQTDFITGYRIVWNPSK
jgi:hypothetical protein